MLRLLGPPTNAGKGKFPIRGYEIAAALSLEFGGRLERRSMASLLWPESPEPLAMGNLRYVLHAMKAWSKLNGFNLLDTSATAILKRATPVCDVDELLLSRPDSLATLADFTMRFGGELLQGHTGSSAEFEDWLTGARTKLNQLFVQAVLDAADNLCGPAVNKALVVAEQKSPYDERICVARIRGLVNSGHRQAAILAYGQIEARFRDDLGARLDIRTRQIINLLVPETLAASGFDSASEAQRAATQKFAAAPRSTGAAGLPTVLILPPAMNACHSAHDYFLGRALVSEVTIMLGRMRTFAMFAPFTARRVAQDDPLVAARSIGASYVVATTLLSSGSRAFLGFSLCHAGSQEVLMADRVPIEDSGRGDVDDRLATAIAATISNHISNVEIRRLHRTGEASAYTHYLLGQERLSYDLKSIRKARSHFQRAAVLSPKFAPAHAMLARTLSYEWLVLGRPEPDLLLEALRLAAIASEMDPLLASGSWEMGHALLYLQRLDESLEHIDHALDRSPHIADLVADRADVLVHLNEGRSAKETILRAMELNPVVPDEYHWVLGSSDFLLGNYAATLDSLNRMADTSRVARLMAACHAMLGDVHNASLQRRRWLEDYPDFRVQDWVKVIPMRDKHVAEQIVDAMRTAGFH